MTDSARASEGTTSSLSAAHPLAELVPWGTRTLCKCPHCGGLDVSYLGRDGLDICGTCHGLFVCRQEPVNAE